MLNAGKTPHANFNTKQKIILVKHQIRVTHTKYNAKLMSTVIYHDQLEELYSTLNKLKIKMQEKDVLESWCEENPSDFECRGYDV